MNLQLFSFIMRNATTHYLIYSIMEKERISIIVSPELMSVLGKDDIEIRISLKGDSTATVSQEADMLAYMSQKISEKAMSGKVRTAEAYRATLTRWEHFLATIGIDKSKGFTWSRLTPRLICSFAEYLCSRKVSRNTQSFYLRILRAVCNRARQDGHSVANDLFKDVYTGKAKTKKRALHMDDIRHIAALDISNSKEKLARDLFVFSFMTRGMAMIDIANLTKQNIKNGRLTYKRHKTGKAIDLEWLDYMQKIVDEYKDCDSRFLFPILQDTRQDAWHEYKKAQLRINYHLKKLGIRLGLPINLTMYVARHSWATTAKASGVPTAVISDAMGHTSERTTQIYLDSIDEGRIDSANQEIMNRLFAKG